MRQASLRSLSTESDVAADGERTIQWTNVDVTQSMHTNQLLKSEKTVGKPLRPRVFGCGKFNATAFASTTGSGFDAREALHVDDAVNIRHFGCRVNRNLLSILSGVRSDTCGSVVFAT